MVEADTITGQIISCAYQIHIEIGPGLLETAYEAMLAHLLDGAGYRVERQKGIAFEYRGVRLREGFRVDLLVNETVVVEVKSVEQVAKVHKKQLLTYLKLLNLPVGLLLNFGAERMKDGIHRVVNNYRSPFRPPSGG